MAASTPPNVFELKGRVISWIDADTLEMHPFILPAGFNLRIRLKDAWIVEDEDDPEEHARILLEQIAMIGNVGEIVKITNTRHHHTYGRLEARVDPGAR